MNYCRTKIITLSLLPLILSKRHTSPVFMPAQSPYKVLIVDDSPPMLEALQYLLHDESDLEVIGVAETGARAIQVAAERHPDIVLLDVNLPDQKGYEVTEMIKKQVPTPLVILISAHGDAQTRQRGLEAGSDGFIEKGTERHKINRKILDILAQKI